MNINLNLYEVFYSVAKNKSITLSAKELMISQPAISKSIKTLEESLNTKLFTRKRDGVELTEAGKAIYNKIKDALSLISSAQEDIKSLNNLDKGYLTIGASKTIIEGYILDYIKGFHELYPNITIRIYTESINELVKKAKIDLVDIIFANLPYNFPDYFEVENIMTLHDCFAANEKFSYLKNKKITKKDLETLPLLLLTKGTIARTRLDEYLTSKNIIVNPKMEFGSNSLLKSFTLSGFGIGMLTKEHIKKEIEEGKLFTLNHELSLKEKNLGMIYDSSKKNNTILKTFIDYINKNKA